jgi:hypothetical protein
MKAQFITDIKGNKISVILPIKDYEKILEELEELENIKAYDRAKSMKSEPVPFEEAVRELEKIRNGKI